MSRIIPAIDLIDGKCVRLEKGDYAKKKVYNSDPLEVAKEFEDNGLKYLHLVDLDGAKAGRLINWKVLETIANNTSLEIDLGGGIKSDEDLQIAFDSGAKQINVGSLAVKNPELFLSWVEAHGGDKMILSADVSEGFVAIHGWQTVTDIKLLDFIGDYRKAGVLNVTCTDIAKDGMLQGASNELYQEVLGVYPDINLIASGGVSSMADVESLIDMKVFGIIIGKAIYEGRVTLAELSRLG